MQDGGGHHFVKVFHKIGLFFKRWLPLYAEVVISNGNVQRNRGGFLVWVAKPLNHPVRNGTNAIEADWFCLQILKMPPLFSFASITTKFSLIFPRKDHGHLKNSREGVGQLGTPFSQGRLRLTSRTLTGSSLP